MSSKGFRGWQETSLKEKDEVLVKEDTTLRGKVLRVENSSGRPSKVTLLFDTNFKKNPNLDALLSPHMRCISIMQAKFSLNDGGDARSSGRSIYRIRLLQELL